jgi:DNA-binding response OmpR family regulator
MPDTDGLEVLRQLRANERTRETPVLLVSACADPDLMSEASRLGCADYLTKPVDGPTLKAKVGALLGLTVPASQGSDLVGATLRLLT